MISGAARGDDARRETTFPGLSLTGQHDLSLFPVAERLSRNILAEIAGAGQFDEKPGAGIAFRPDIEDAVGPVSRLETISPEIEDQK
jgi:hypothetical protein